MSDRDVDLNIRAQTADAEAGMARMADAVGRSTLLMREHFGRLGSVVESIKVPFAALAALLAGGELFKDVVEETANFAVSLEKMSQKTGIAIEELQKLRFAASQSHVGTEELDTGLVRLARTMESAAQHNKEAVELFRALGISATDGTGHLRPLDDVVQDIAAKFASFKDSPEKAAIAMKLFGRSGAELIPVLNHGKAGLAELGAEAQALGGIMDADGVRGAVEYEQAMSRFHEMIKGIEHTLGTLLIPALTVLGNIITGVVLSFETFLGNAADYFDVFLNNALVWANRLGFALNRLAHGDVATAKLELKKAADETTDNWTLAIDKITDRTKRWHDEIERLFHPKEQHEGGGTGNAPRLPGVDDEAAAKARIDGKMREELAKLAIERDALAYRREIGQTSADDEIASERDILSREQAVKFNALNAELKLYADNAKEKARVEAEFHVLAAQNALENQKLQEKAAREYIKTWQHVADSVSQSFATSYETLIDHTGKFRDVLLKLGQSLEHWLIESGFRQLTQHILIERAKTAATAEGAGERTSISALAATKSLAIDIAAGLKSIAVESVKAIARAWAAISAIPFVGPFIAPGIALGTGAAILALGGRIASASGGYDIPSGINPMTQLHAQEMVLPADLANVIRGMARGGGGMGGGATYHIHAMDAQSFRDFAKRNPQGFADGVNAAKRSGHLG